MQYLSSYPTYEEWKPAINPITHLPTFLFLSYLWGMETLQELLIHIV